MADPRSIAIISPHAWPAHDDLTWRVAYEAEALARRGHAVSILTPVRASKLVADGRRRLHELRGGDEAAVIPASGEVRVVPLGRALPAGSRRTLGGPIDIATTLEDLLSKVAFDIVHVHEPLAPSPALAALRHTRGVTAATFYRPEQLAGVAFVQPLLERAMGRLDVWLSATDTARRAVEELFARTCQVIPGGVDTTRFRLTSREHSAGPPGLVIVARSTDRAGLRFALRVVRSIDLDQIGPITVVGPSEAPWRTRAAIPKSLRERVSVVADTSPEVRAAAFASAEIALIASADELGGSCVLEAMACGCATLIPRSADTDSVITHGRTGRSLPPFSRDAWVAAVDELARDRDGRSALGAAGAAIAAERSWDRVAEDLEAAYMHASQRTVPTRRARTGRIVADLCVHPGPDLTARQIVDGCVARGIDAVAVIGEDDPDVGVSAAAMAREQLVVVPGQLVNTSDGSLIGLFVQSPIDHGLGLEESIGRIHVQGGVVMVPHPGWTTPPSRDALRRHHALMDCFETLRGPAPVARAGVGEDATVLAQRFGMLAVAGSGATTEEDLGCAHLRMRSFSSARAFLDALVDAEPVQRRRGLRTRVTRERRHPETPAT